MIGLLFVAQTALPPSCGSAMLCRLLEAAAAANEAAALAPGGYRAVAETETATLGRWEGRIEGATLLEQTSSEVRWSGDDGLTQRVVGSRSFPNAIPLSRLAFMKIGWVVPTLVGQRLSVIPRNGPGETRYRQTLSGPLAAILVIHPLGADRERYYRYTGGDRVTRTIDGTPREVLAVQVAMADSAPERRTLFEGEMDLDPASLAVVRLNGRIRAPGPKRRGGALNLAHLFEPSETLVDLISQRLPGAGWVPLLQRFEIQTESALASGYGATRRVISRFHDARALPRDPGALSVPSTTGYSLTSAPSDSLRRFRGWRTTAGTMTDAVADADFGGFRPARLQPTGPPLVLLQGYNSGHFLRVNRIEGVFTGASVIAPLRDMLPGVSLQVTGGYAWSEKAVRGGAGARWTRGGWLLEGGGARSLDVTNDFRDQFDSPNTSALLGRDNWDYVDRLGGGIAAARRLDHAGSLARLEVAWVEDREVSRHMDRSFLRSRLRDNRAIAEGSYLRSRLLLDWHPAVSPVVARDGIGFRGELEQAGGDLDYTRVEARVVVRKSLRPLYLLARIHAGAVFSRHPPPQQLFELGGSAGFPGYEYKEFAGNRALLVRTRVTYPLPLLDTPVRLGRGITLPALAPAVSFGIQTGLADATSAAARDAVAALTSVPADRLKTSVDIRIGIFGDALGVGLARALTSGRKTTFFVAIGRQF